MTFFLFGAVALVIASKLVFALVCACIAVAGAVVAASCLVPNGAASSYLVLPMPCKAADIFFFRFRPVFLGIGIALGDMAKVG